MYVMTPKYSATLARQKMIQWCNKAERCHGDVRQKLLGWGIKNDDRENIIVVLIEPINCKLECATRVEAAGACVGMN